MSAPSTSGLSVELLLRVIDLKYGYFTLLYLERSKRHLSLKTQNNDNFSKEKLKEEDSA